MRISTGSVTLRPNTQTTTGKKAERSKPQPGALAKSSVSDAKLTSLISRPQLLELSRDLKNGVLNREEASHQFIDSVAYNALKEKLSDKDREKLVHDISEFFKEDPDFIQKLEKNLLDLA